MDVLKLASLGWRLIAMQRATKNPGSLVGEEWPSKATSDPATVKAWSELGLNFGVLLGPSSGVIDVEYDSDEGREILKDAEPTLSYKSAKSVHRIYLYDERFVHEKTKVSINGTEWRFGQDKAQSVIPPSLHENGKDSYEWIDVREPVRLPDSMWELYQRLKASDERHKARERPQDVPPRDRTGDSLIDLARAEAEKLSWESLLTSQGWTFVRNRGEAQDWLRPGKYSGTISATVNYGGTGTLRVFSTNCSPLVEDSSYDKFAFICVTEYEDDPIAAAKGILPQSVQDELDRKWRKERNEKADLINLDNFMTGGTFSTEDEELDDEQFIASMIPDGGIIKQAFDFYGKVAYRRSIVMGMAVSVSLCQTIFGRRVRSHTDLRTNDYNLILATTGSGKEACESTITKILDAADPGCHHMIPPDVQSGNGLMRALSMNPCSIWVCDEFGKILQAVLDKKGNPHTKTIGNHLLKLYGKSNGTYGGAAHSDGVRNRIVNPHLCVLGLATGSSVFEAVAAEHVSDGLLGRIAFWPVQERPDPKDEMEIADPPEELVEAVKQWVDFQPGGNLVTTPEVLRMSDEALARWNIHGREINERMKSESEIRAAVWSRVAARTMKLALVHRCSRLEVAPANCQWDFVQIELSDMQWAVKLSNWLARISCGLIRENIQDTGSAKAKAILAKAIESSPNGVNKRKLLRICRSITAGDLQCAAEEIGLVTVNRNPKGRPSIWYERPPVSETC